MAIRCRAPLQRSVLASENPCMRCEYRIRVLLTLENLLPKCYICFVFGVKEVTAMDFKVASRVRGLSDAAFREAFGTEEQCRNALARLRWRDGFICPGCGHRGHCRPTRRPLYQCNHCKKQTSLTAGTIFHSTKLPLTVWFAAIHLIVTARNGISSVELGRRLGVRQATAWTMKQKIMAMMARREGEKSSSRRVGMDDTHPGGVRSGGKQYKSDASAAAHETALGLSDAGIMAKRTMRVFEDLCLTPIEDMTPEEIREIRMRENVSQGVFARYLNVATGSVSQWERGEKLPRGASLKLLTLVAKNGLAAIA